MKVFILMSTNRLPTTKTDMFIGVYSSYKKMLFQMKKYYFSCKLQNSDFPTLYGFRDLCIPGGKGGNLYGFTDMKDGRELYSPFYALQYELDTRLFNDRLEHDRLETKIFKC